MDKIRILVNELRNKEKDEQVKILQKINKLLLTEYIVNIGNNFKIYPIEVEAYYCNKESSFEDDTVHKNELQKNRYGKLYFHRKGGDENNKILFFRSGIDICLSDGNYYYGVLIRSAIINSEPTIINGPQLLAQKVYKCICGDENLINLSREILCKFEKETNCLERSKNREIPVLIHSSRIGLNAASPFSQLRLRSLVDLNVSKQKEKDVLAYMTENNINPTPENIKSLLGYSSKSIIEKLKGNV